MSEEIIVNNKHKEILYDANGKAFAANAKPYNFYARGRGRGFNPSYAPRPNFQSQYFSQQPRAP